MKAERIKDGQEAVFLPGRIHGAEHQVYILSMNWDANDGQGSFDIKIVDDEEIVQAYNLSKDEWEFWDTLADICQGKWKYCDAPSYEFDDYANVFFEGDFVTMRDGAEWDEMEFLVNWVVERRRHT